MPKKISSNQKEKAEMALKVQLIGNNKLKVY